MGLFSYHMPRVEVRHRIFIVIQLVTGKATGVLLFLPMLLMAVITSGRSRPSV